MRLFAAVFLPDGISQKLYGFSKEVAERFNAKAVIPESMHITLNFFGEADPENAFHIVGEAMKGISKFKIDVKGAGFFSSRGVARVLWAGVHCASGALGRIASAFGPGEKDFKPHVTLARFPGSGCEPESLRAYLESVSAEETFFGSFCADRTALAESVLGSGTPQYRKIKNFALGE